MSSQSCDGMVFPPRVGVGRTPDDACHAVPGVEPGRATVGAELLLRPVLVQVRHDLARLLAVEVLRLRDALEVDDEVGRLGGAAALDDADDLVQAEPLSADVKEFSHAGPP